MKETFFKKASKGHKRQSETHTMFLDIKTHSKDICLLKANL